jgi:hypothetical protein
VGTLRGSANSSLELISLHNFQLEIVEESYSVCFYSHGGGNSCPLSSMIILQYLFSSFNGRSGKGCDVPCHTVVCYIIASIKCSCHAN